MTEKKRYNIGIATWPISKSGLIPLRNLVAILHPLSREFRLITGGAGYTFLAKNKKLHIYEVKHRSGTNTFTRVVNYSWTQLKISYKLMKLSRNIDLWFFFIGAEGLILPILTVKLLRKKVIIASAGSGVKVAQAQGDPLTRVSALLQGITYRLSNRIIIYSIRLVKQNNLDKYLSKILITRKHFLNFNELKVQKRIVERKNWVGYIGSLSESKGVPYLLQAIPKVLSSENQVKFLIGGDGEFRGEVEEFLNMKNLNGKVKYIGWISHDELPQYLNRLKLLVLPSCTEGLPNIVLEAMACGTPVLATPVGAIPDIIRDGETGFIMGDNSPKCIARNITRALNHPDLEEIAQNARVLVEREFTYESAVTGYRKLLSNLADKH
ncbi:glycosyltransferase family 4 protein [Chloroflexota bacterium]